MIYKYVPKIAPVPDEDSEEYKRIVIPEKSGTPATVIVFENGMNAYIFREAGDFHAADRLVEFIQHFLESFNDEFLGLPSSFNPEILTWVPRKTLQTLLNIHDAVVESPIASRSHRGKDILVPMGDAMVKIPSHGPGKRNH